MSVGKARWLFRAGIASGVAALAFAALASIGGAVSPSGTPAVAAEYPKKVTICHKTGSRKNPFRTIVVSQNAVPAHLKHGDKMGPCSTATFTLCQKAKGKAHKTVKVKGAKNAVKQLRRGAKLGKCKASKQKHSKKKGKPSKPGKSGQKGKSG
jgi:ABC-type sugar transport system substrate-binding protein